MTTRDSKLYSDLLPALARAREAARRASCQNNLKQWGLIFKMYAGEAKGAYPPGMRYSADAWTQWQGVDSSVLYPEYWTDVNIMLCPSDSRAGWTGYAWSDFPDIGDDVAAQVQRIANHQSVDATEERAKHVCLHSVLSFPISYLYVPFAVSTMSQWCQVYFASAGANAGPLTEVHYRAATTAVGCPAAWYGAGYYPERTTKTVSGGTPFLAGYSMPYDDDGVSLVPTSLNVTKEGVERFFITDINNPAASAKAESNIITMFDAWAAEHDRSLGWPGANTTVYFNHIPGGSNVLYMDGHVEYVRFGQKGPVFVGKQPNSLSYFSPLLMSYSGGMG